MSIELIIALSGVFISIISVSVAIWSAKKSNSFSKEQTELQRRVVELEEQRELERKLKEDRADLRPILTYKPGKEGYSEYASYFQIENNGKMKADNIRMYVDGDPVTQHKYMMRHHDYKLGSLNPGRPKSWSVHITEEDPEICEVELKWDDETGKDHSFKEKVALKR